MRAAPILRLGLLLGFICVVWPSGRVCAQAEEPPPAAVESAPPEKIWPKPEQVTVGVYINDIQSIDLKTHTYAVDAYFWFRWQNPNLDPASSMEFINPSDLWGHTVKNAYEKPVELPDGSWYQSTRVQGRFSKKMPLFNYPFDRQTLDLVFEDSLSEATDLVYVLGDPPVTLNPGLVLPGYVIGTPKARVALETYPTNFGDLRAPAPGLYARLRVEVPVSRPTLAYAVKLMLPVLCVMVCALLMFLFAPRYVDARVSVGTTSFLTVVALQMTLNQDLPDVGYLMLMDKIYLCSYFFIISGLIATVRTTRQVEVDPEETGVRRYRGLLVAVVLAYLGAIGALVTHAIRAG